MEMAVFAPIGRPRRMLKTEMLSFSRILRLHSGSLKRISPRAGIIRNLGITGLPTDHEWKAKGPAGRERMPSSG